MGKKPPKSSSKDEQVRPVPVTVPSYPQTIVELLAPLSKAWEEISKAHTVHEQCSIAKSMVAIINDISNKCPQELVKDVSKSISTHLVSVLFNSRAASMHTTLVSVFDLLPSAWALEKLAPFALAWRRYLDQKEHSLIEATPIFVMASSCKSAREIFVNTFGDILLVIAIVLEGISTIASDPKTTSDVRRTALENCHEFLQTTVSSLLLKHRDTAADLGAKSRAPLLRGMMSAFGVAVDGGDVMGEMSSVDAVGRLCKALLEIVTRDLYPHSCLTAAAIHMFSFISAATPDRTALARAVEAVFLSDMFHSLGTYGQQAFCRGVLSCDDNTILTDLSTNTSPVPAFLPRKLFALVYSEAAAPVPSTSEDHILHFRLSTIMMWERKLYSALEANGRVPGIDARGLSAALMNIVQENWEHSFTGLAGASIKLLTNVLSLHELLVKSEGAGTSAAHEEFLINVIQSLLTLSWSQKVKMKALAVVIPLLPYKRFMDIAGDSHFVERVFACMASESLKSSAGVVLRTLLEISRAASPSEAAWSEEWSENVIGALRSCPDTSGQDQIITNLIPTMITAAGPGFLDSFLSRVFTCRQNEDSVQVWSHVMVCTLRVSRQKSFITLRDTLKRMEDPAAPAWLSTLRSVLRHSMHSGSEDTRLNALDFVCCSPTSTEVVCSGEYELVKSALPSVLKGATVRFRSKVVNMVQRLLYRMRDSLYSGSSKNSVRMKAVGDIEGSIEDVKVFLRWLSSVLWASVYPGGAYSRRVFALEILRDMVLVWSGAAAGVSVSATARGSGEETSDKGMGRRHVAKRPEEGALQRERVSEIFVSLDLVNEANVNTLTNLLVDSWDPIRRLAYETLMMFPRPLPGLSTDESIRAFALWSLELMRSPRVRESEAGAFMGLLLHRKYVCEMGCDLRIVSSLKSNPGLNDLPCDIDVTCRIPSEPPSENELAEREISFVESLVDLTETFVESSKRSISRACTHNISHGPVLAIRYILDGFNADSRMANSNVPRMSRLIARLLDCLARVFTVTRWLLSYTEEELFAVKNAAESSAGVSPQASDIDDGANRLDASAWPTLANFKRMEDRYSSEMTELVANQQAVIVSAWLSLKEASLLLGVLVKRLPLPSELLSGDDVRSIGLTFLSTLMSIVHNGAIDKTHVGFLSVNERLRTTAGIGELSDLPMEWLEFLLHKLKNEDFAICRRSAGLPFCILSFLDAEPSKYPRVLLRRTMADLMSLAAGHAGRALPRVHALNVLKFIMLDSNLSVNVAPYLSECLITSIRGFSHPDYPIRNASMIAFSAILTRCLSGRLLRSGDDERTGGMFSSDFFSRYPAVFDFCKDALGRAVQGTSDDPMLYPVLVVLSNLVPPPLMDPGASNSSSELLEPLAACCSLGPMHIRDLAARSLAALQPQSSYISHLQRIMNDLASNNIKKANTLHGLLLILHRSTRMALSGVMPPTLREACRRDVIPLVSNVLGTLTGKSAQWPGLARGMMFRIIADIVLPVVEKGNSDGAISAKVLLGLADASVSAGTLFDTHTNCNTTKRFDIGAAFARTHATRVLVRANAVLCRSSDHWAGMASTLKYLFSIERSGVFAAVEESILFDTEHGAPASVLSEMGDVLWEIVSEDKDCSRAQDAYVCCRLLSRLPDIALVKVVEGAGGTDAMWSVLQHLHDLTTSSNLKSSVMVLAGRTLSIAQAESVTLSSWVKLLEAGCHVSQDLGIRRAAAEALAVSTALSSSNSDIGVRCWMVAACLLQDDDADLREFVARTLWGLVDKRAVPEVESESGLCSLSSCLSHVSQAYSGACESAMHALIDGTTRLGAIEWGENRENMTKIVFEKEEENFFVEDLHAAVAAAESLRALKCSSGLESHITALERMVAVLVEARADLLWAGGITYHPDVFVAFAVHCTGLRGIAAAADGPRRDNARGSATGIVADLEKLHTNIPGGMHRVLRGILEAVGSDADQNGSLCPWGL